MANMTVEDNISVQPIIKAKEKSSFRKITPKIMLIIGSKVPKIDEEVGPIISMAFNKKIIDAIVVINANIK